MDEKAGVAQKAFALIKWVDSWKKLTLFMVLVTFCASGYALWDYRRELAFWGMASFGTPQIDEAAIDSEAEKLLADLGATSIAVWSINLERNQRTALYSRVKDQRLSNQEGISDLALRPYSKLTAEIITLIDEKTSCWPHVANTPVGVSARDAGVTYVCAAAIPPQFGMMIGMLSIGFAAPPPNEDYVKFRLKQTAERIIR